MLLSYIVLSCTMVHAHAAQTLVERINAYRDAPEDCAGHNQSNASPLAPNEDLSRVRMGRGDDVRDALGEVGYDASAVKAITLTGPQDVDSAMRALVQQYCAALLDPTYSEIGASRSGRTWRVVLAQPLLPEDLGDWQTAGRQILELVNAARAESRSCGSRRFQAARPLSWNQTLGAAALAHSRDMAQHDYFSHQGPQGRRVGDRANAEGYDWQRIGENIAAGVRSPERAVAGWVSSPRHCENLMDPRFTEMGAAYAVNPDSTGMAYWTQVFGKPQQGTVRSTR